MYDQWIHLKPEPKSMFSGWIKSAWLGGKKEMQDSMDQKLNFVLNTAPMWDRFVPIFFVNCLLHELSICHLTFSIQYAFSHS